MHAAEWLALRGVAGVAQGLCDGEPCIRVFVTDPAVSVRLPGRVHGYPLRVEITDGFRI